MKIGGLTTAELLALRVQIDDELRRRELSRMCQWCGRMFTAGTRKARFCSDRCRVASHRDRLPDELMSRRRWVRHDGKRPITIDGRPASVSDPSTWSGYATATASTVGDGVGFVLGDGISCWDFDHCISAEGIVPRELVDLICSVDPFRVEVSMSGRGLHAWVCEPESDKNFRREIDGFKVEHYTRARFIALGHKVPDSLLAEG